MRAIRSRFGRRRRFLDKLTTGKNATYATIGVAALIAVALFFVWHAVRGIFIHPADVPVASAPAQPTAAPAPAANPATPDASPAPAATASANAPQPIVVPAQKATAALRVPAEVRRAPNRSDAAADSDAARLRDRKQDAAGASPMVPAMVLSQPQPTLPPLGEGHGVGWSRDDGRHDQRKRKRRGHEGVVRTASAATRSGTRARFVAI